MHFHNIILVIISLLVLCNFYLCLILSNVVSNIVEFKPVVKHIHSNQISLLIRNLRIAARRLNYNHSHSLWKLTKQKRVLSPARVVQWSYHLGAMCSRA